MTYIEDPQPHPDSPVEGDIEAVTQYNTDGVHMLVSGLVDEGSLYLRLDPQGERDAAVPLDKEHTAVLTDQLHRLGAEKLIAERKSRELPGAVAQTYEATWLDEQGVHPYYLTVRRLGHFGHGGTMAAQASLHNPLEDKTSS